MITSVKYIDYLIALITPVTDVVTTKGRGRKREDATAVQEDPVTTACLDILRTMRRTAVVEERQERFGVSMVTGALFLNQIMQAVLPKKKRLFAAAWSDWNVRVGAVANLVWRLSPTSRVRCRQTDVLATLLDMLSVEYPGFCHLFYTSDESDHVPAAVGVIMQEMERCTDLLVSDAGVREGYLSMDGSWVVPPRIPIYANMDNLENLSGVDHLGALVLHNLCSTINDTICRQGVVPTSPDHRGMMVAAYNFALFAVNQIRSTTSYSDIDTAHGELISKLLHPMTFIFKDTEFEPLISTERLLELADDRVQVTITE